MATFLKIKLKEGGSYGTSLSGAKGTHVIVAQAPSWTGRVSRVNTVKAVSDDDNSKSASAKITQLGSNVFRFTTSGTTTENGTVVFGGGVYKTKITTNAVGIKIAEVDTNDCTIVVKNGATTLTGVGGVYTPAGDPGATGVYTLDIEITVPVNENANNVIHKFNFTNQSATAMVAVLTLTQAQANPTISLTPLTAEIAFAGGTVDLTLTTNDDWTASVTE